MMSDSLFPVSEKFLFSKWAVFLLAPPKTDDTLDLLFKNISSICEPLWDWRFKIACTYSVQSNHRTQVQCKKFGLVSDPSTKTIEALFIGRDSLIISMISHSITYAKSWPKPRIRTGTQHGWFSNGQVQSPLAWLHNYLIFRKMPWYCIVLWSHLWTY